ncbi:MAG: cytochrome c oxidase subunit 3 [Planctomycetota bacterium]
MSHHPDGHDDHGGHHDPHLAHHFHTMVQQVGSAKLGMWTFLATEILMFGGLFCAYAVYRALHPEVFLFGHYFLDTNLGAINTAVLLVSSFTMAWGVRAAQLGQTTLLVVLLALTFLGGCGFMAIKYVEYTAKFDHGLGPGTGIYVTTTETFSDGNTAEVKNYLVPNSAFIIAGQGGVKYGVGEPTSDQLHQLEDALHYHEKYALKSHTDQGGHKDYAAGESGKGDEHAEDHSGSQATPAFSGEAVPREPILEQDFKPTGALATSARTDTRPPEHSAMTLATNGSFGLSDTFQTTGIAASPVKSAELEVGFHEPTLWDSLTEREQSLAYQFFSIYYCMTGLHGLHVLIGMGLIAWVAVRALGGTFGPEYNVPVDLVGLYWHLVDLIWIFLFPLLYLIH